MVYSSTIRREIQELISRLYGEPVSVEQAIETYEEMVDSDDSESTFQLVK